MAKIQGQRVGSIKSLKAKLAGSSGKGFIKYVPKEGSLMVRFLTEPDDFYGYWEHFDSTLKRSYACVEDDCPGCATGEDRSFLYLGNVLVIEDDKVAPLQLKKSVVNDLVLRYEKYDTITDRDYEIGKTGEGMATRYYVAPEPKTARKLAKYDLLDLEEVVQAAFEDATSQLTGSDDDDDDEPTPKKAASKSTAKPAKKGPIAKEADPDEDDEDEAEETDSEYTKAQLAEMDEDELTEAAEAVNLDPDDYETWDALRDAILAAQGESDDESDDDDSEEDDEDESDEADDEADDDEEGDFWTAEELAEKSPGELKAIARDYNISTKGMRPKQIIDALLEA